MSDQFKALILNQKGEEFTREVKLIDKSFLKHGDSEGVTNFFVICFFREINFVRGKVQCVGASEIIAKHVVKPPNRRMYRYGRVKLVGRSIFMALHTIK